MLPITPLLMLFSLLAALALIIAMMVAIKAKCDNEEIKFICDEVKSCESKPRLTWDQYFMGLAFAVAQRSEDPLLNMGAY